jgi:hypothetical protein
MRFGTVLAAAFLVTALSQGLASAASGWHRIAASSQSGSFLIASARASTTHPKGLEVRVTAAPRGRVGGNALVDCDGKTVHRHVHGATPILRVLPLPVAHPGRCSVVVNVTYAAHGTVALAILSR